MDPRTVARIHNSRFFAEIFVEYLPETTLILPIVRGVKEPCGFGIPLKDVTFSKPLHFTLRERSRSARMDRTENDSYTLDFLRLSPGVSHAEIEFSVIRRCPYYSRNVDLHLDIA